MSKLESGLGSAQMGTSADQLEQVRLVWDLNLSEVRQGALRLNILCNLHITKIYMENTKQNKKLDANKRWAEWSQILFSMTDT